MLRILLTLAYNQPSAPMRFFTSLFLLAFVALLPTQVLADEYAILVAPRDTPAQAFAASKANDTNIFAQRTLHRALTQAAELLQSGSHTVTVFVAAGEYKGKARQGIWEIPTIDNPAGTLRIMGGYNDDFSGRQPFGLLSVLVTSEGRNGAFLQFGRRSALKQLVISGLLFDAAPSNKYDSRSNSILKGQSRTYTMISFSQLRTDHLVVADNIFMNGSHGVFDPFIMPMSANTVVDIQNNVFMNNIKAMKLQASSSRGTTVSVINLRQNTFFLNWPYNPDPTSSNVSAIELYHKDGGAHFNIEGNLFAFNPGGAMQHDWPEDRMPEITIKDNLFYQNAALFEEGEEESGVIAGKFGLNPKYLILDLYTLEDDFDYNVSGNVTLDPQIGIALADLQAADSYSVQRENTTLNDVRRLFGLNQSGGTVAIANYAPAMSYTFPQPTNEAAKKYGAQPQQLWNGN